MPRQLPEFMRTEESMFAWAENEASDFFSQGELDEETVKDEMWDLVYDYRSQAKRVMRDGEVVGYRYIRVLEDRWQDRINWDCLGKYWSWELDGAGVQEGPSGEGPWVDVLLVGRLKFEDIDWEHGFYSYVFYTDQKEIAAEANRQVVVEAIGLKPKKWGEAPKLQKLKPPVTGNVGPVEIDNWSEVCKPVALPAFGAKGDPTDLNLWVLERLFKGTDTAPNAMTATSKPHIRRCWKAGLLTIDGPQLRLTEKGKAVIGFRASKGGASNDNFGRRR